MIKTLDGTIILLSIRNGLVYLDIRPPTVEELNTLLHVVFTADMDWDPSFLDKEYEFEEVKALIPAAEHFIIDP